jgi:transposase
MPFSRTKPDLNLDNDTYKKLLSISYSRTEKLCRIERAKILLSYHDGKTINNISIEMKKSRSIIYNTINKALEFGAIASLDDLHRSGRPPVITDEAKSWIISTACSKPKELGLPHEFWTRRLLAKYLRDNCKRYGHVCLSKIVNGTVTKILKASNIQPQKVKYYIQKRDPDFEIKRENVIAIYKEAAIIRDHNNSKILNKEIYISYDEKTGIQALKNIAPDLPPIQGKYQSFSRDPEYIRLGTVSLLAGLNIVTGRVDGIVEKRHRSYEFIKFLKKTDRYYHTSKRITIVLDNHSAHTSKETRAYLSTVPNRFRFIFTPKHGSWLNMIESFFGKMARSVLKDIRVDTIDELKRRILKYLALNNKKPVPHIWTFF